MHCDITVKNVMLNRLDCTPIMKNSLLYALFFLLSPLSLNVADNVAQKNEVKHEIGRTESRIDIRTSRLKNGIKVFLVPMPTDVVSLRIVVTAGASSEKPGKTGVAHYIEHLMFLNSGFKEKHMKLVRQNAFSFNAYTGYDSTTYMYDRVPNDKLVKILRNESSRFNNFGVSKKDASHELSVVLEEVSMIKNSRKFDYAVLDSILLLFPGERYSTHVHGKISDLKSLTSDDAKDFYKENYIPENISILITGGVDETTILPLLDELFGQIPIAKHALTTKPPHPINDHRKLYVERPNKQATPSVVLVWKNGPSMTSNKDEFLTFNMCCDTLNETSGSLYKHFVKEKHMVKSIEMSHLPIGVEYYCPIIVAELAEGIEERDFQKEMSSFMQNLVEKGMSEEQLRLCQKGMQISLAYEREDPAKIASSLSTLIEAKMDPHSYNDFSGIYSSLTIRYVNKIFRKYLSSPPDLIVVVKGEE